MRLVHKFMEQLAHRTTMWAGRSWAFLIALGLTVLWLVSGPFFGFSDTWQLVMNTVSSIVTFLMVFLLQRSQNKDALAMQIKLNEIIASLPRASNRLINIEDLPEAEVRELHDHYQKLLQRVQDRGKQTGTLSIEKAILKSEREAAAG